MTLLELMIVVAIVAILAAVAIPAYDGYVTRSRRSDAFTALETVRAAQEMYRAEKGYYLGGFADLAGCDSGMAGDNYTISITWTDNTHYTSTAQAQAKQAGDHDFQIDQDGNKSYDGTPVNSWEEVPRD